MTGLLDNSSGEFARRQTTVRMTWSGERLFMVFESAVPEADALVARPHGRDGNVWEDDAIEVFLSPHGEGYLQLVANSRVLEDLPDARGNARRK